jgi:hypothetical protein
MSRISKLRFPAARTAVLVAIGVLVCAGVAVQAGRFTNQRSVGGVAVDANGVVAEITISQRQEALKRLRQSVGQPGAELSLPAEMRKVSLRGLEAALQDSLTNNQGKLPDEVKFLAGLQRIQYILIYPDQQDIVLAGPGEGWRVDDQTNIVGQTNGLPILQLEDLLIAFRTVERARTEGISVSIDPTPEGLRNFERFMGSQRQFSPAVLKGIKQAMGMQQISFSGVPTNTHFAQVLLAADYRMKRLALDPQEPRIEGLPSFLQLLQQKRQQPSSAMPRWWMACNYEPLARSDDRLVWELRGPGVKAMTEDEFIQNDGTVRGTGRQDPVAKQWADQMTAKFEDLADSSPVFAELRNVMDMCVVAALLEREDLCGLAGGTSFPLLTGKQGGMAVENWNTPKAIPTQCSFLKVGRNYVITASGGVEIDSWSVAANSKVDPKVKQVHGEAAKPAEATWFWN